MSLTLIEVLSARSLSNALAYDKKVDMQELEAPMLRIVKRSPLPLPGARQSSMRTRPVQAAEERALENRSSSIQIAWTRDLALRYEPWTLDEVCSSYVRASGRIHSSSSSQHEDPGRQYELSMALHDKLKQWKLFYDELKQIKGVEWSADNWIWDCERRKANFWDPIPTDGVIPSHL